MAEIKVIDVCQTLKNISKLKKDLFYLWVLFNSIRK